MIRWFHSIQFRLIAGFAAVLALVIAAVSAYATVATRTETERFAKEQEEARAERIGRLVQQAYQANQDWDQVRYTIEQAANLLGWRVVIHDDSGGVIADSHQTAVRTTDLFAQLDGPFRLRQRVYQRPVIMGDEVVGLLLVVDQEPDFAPGSALNPRFRRPAATALAQLAPESRGPPVLVAPLSQPRRRAGPSTPFEVDALIADQLAPEPRLARLEASFRQSLIMAGAAAGAAGVLVIGLLTRQALAPVRGLTNAARRLGKGDLSYRVPQVRRDELGQLAATFNEMAVGLEEAAHLRKAMTADIAHELRTPLTNIQGYLEAIKDGVVQPDTQTIGVLHEQTVHLAHLVDDLRLLALADAGRLNLDKRPLRLDLLAADAVAAFKPRAVDKKINLAVVASMATPLADLDRTRITQVIANLVENALRHTPENGSVNVMVGTLNPYVLMLVIEDSGPGIPADQLARVFDQFYRVDQSRSRTTGGAGLGLTIVKKLVEAHGGSVRAESEPGRGARFIIELPVSKAHQITD